MRKTLVAGLSALTLAGFASAQTPAECQASYSDRKAEEMALIESGMDLMASVREGERDQDQAEHIERALDLLADRDRPVDSHDLAIIDLAAAMLGDESRWDREDDRECHPDDPRVSVFCALQAAAVAVIGQYEHRRTGLQEVRFIIAERTEGRDYAHRLRDYNNDPSTTLADIASLFAETRLVLARRLFAQASCEL